MCVPQSYEVNTLGGIVIYDAVHVLYFSSGLSDLASDTGESDCVDSDQSCVIIEQDDVGVIKKPVSR